MNNDLRSFSVNIFYVAYAAFCTIMVISQQKEARSRDYVFYCRMTSMVLHIANYHIQHCTHQAFEQFGALYNIMHNPDDKHPTPPKFEPNTSEFRHTTE